jgi:hypothetical protein
MMKMIGIRHLSDLTFACNLKTGHATDPNAYVSCEFGTFAIQALLEPMAILEKPLYGAEQLE